MGVAERRQREKEERKKEIINAAECLFFSRAYDEVSMDDIAAQVELNKATLYLYFESKEALYAAIVLRGVHMLHAKYLECMENQDSGFQKVARMGEAYLHFSEEYPDYLRMIHFYGSERFSRENPYTAGIGRGYGMSRKLLQDAICEGIGDGTIRSDIDPFLISMYLMISFMGTLSLEDKWKQVIAAEGFSNEKFSKEYFRFIMPAITGRRSEE